MIVAGLDLSLTSTGVARIDGGSVHLERLQPKKLTGHERLEYLLGATRVTATIADLVVIEGPSYGSQGGSQHERAGLWWLVAHMLWTSRKPYAVVVPAGLKKYSSGKGNSGKDQVLAAVIRRYRDIPVDGNDVADALVLAAMAADHYGFPLAEVPQVNRQALLAVTWPQLS